MGIRFYCPNGHKLNVKAFLAGRRGICPHCGAKVQIPSESTLPVSTRSRLADSPAAAAGGEVAADSTPLPSRSADFAGSSPSPPLDGDSDVGRSQPTFPPLGESRHRRPSFDAAPGSTDPQWPAGSKGESADVGLRSPRGDAPQAPPMPPTTLNDPPDPLADQPDVVWYVRPPAGGQFGPATGQTVQQWIEEGRISGDSLVWREGWRDWREAAAVFPQLDSSGPIPDIETIGTSRTSGASAGGRPARENHVSVRHQARGIHALVVAVLTLAVVILSVALGWVLLHPTG